MSERPFPKCKNTFNPTFGQLICDDCLKVEEEEFKLVKNYIKIHYGANINEVSKNTGVPVNKILKYVREGKLSTL